MSDIKGKKNGIIATQLYLPQLTEGNLSQYRQYIPLRARSLKHGDLHTKCGMNLL